MDYNYKESKPLNLKAVKKVTATEQVITSIREALAHKQLKYGDKLPNETELAAKLGVGRSSLREGIKALTAFGILEVRQGDGTFVVNRFAEHVFDYLGFVSNAENFKYLMALRRIFEVGCASLVVDRISDEDCRKMEQLTQDMVTVNAQDHLEENTKLDAAFHKTMLQASENPLITEMYSMISNMLCSLMDRLMRYDDVVTDAKEAHFSILHALQKRDREAAELAVSNHLNTVEHYLEKYVFPDME